MTVRLVHLLRQRGRDAALVCAAAGVAFEDVSNPSARVLYSLSDAFLEACVRELGVEGFSLALSRVSDETTYDVAALVLMSGATFGEGLERALLYQRLWGDGERFTLQRADDPRRGGVLRFRHPGPSAVARAVLAEVALLEALSGARALAVPHASPVAVRFAHEPLEDPSALASAFGVEPSFGAGNNELVLPAAILDAPIRLPDGTLARGLDMIAQRAVAALPALTSLFSRVRAICDEDPTALAQDAADVARRLRMSTRTLQRRLRAEGTSWTDIVDGLRRSRARSLALRGASDKEIAFLLGFSDPSSLTRARRRWRREVER
ncbi:MAG: AraC family transcriptional regulator ligand-binding domain-containing protein [Labilithrix sp.]